MSLVLDEWRGLADAPVPRRHSRSKGPPSTPAQRLAELNRELGYVQGALAQAITTIEGLEADLGRYRVLNNVSFGGIPVAQSWTEFSLWEMLLNTRKFRAVFELGTWQGGFSWWLWTQAQIRKIEFHTFDAIQPQTEPPPYCFTRKDIFAYQDELKALFAEWEPLVLFCDNGNKPRELQTFGGALRHAESLVVVHDWGTEVQPEDVPPELTMVYEEQCKTLGSMSRVFQLR